MPRAPLPSQTHRIMSGAFNKLYFKLANRLHTAIEKNASLVQRNLDHRRQRHRYRQLHRRIL